MKSNSKFQQVIILAVMTAVYMFVITRFVAPNQKQRPNESLGDLMTQAQQLNDSKDYKKAISAYDRVTKLYPKSDSAAQAQYEIVLIHEKATGRLNSPDQSIKICRDIVKNYSDRTILVEKDGKRGPANAGQVANDEIKRISYTTDTKNSKNILYQIMDFLVKMTGSKPAFSYTLAILILTVIIKGITTPLNKSQVKQMMAMQRVQPKMKELQTKYKDKPEELNRRMFALYKDNHVNPVGGCLPVLVQMPILMGLYWCIRLYQFQFAKGTFLWIHNLAMPDIPLLIMYAISMYVSVKITSMPTADPSQEMQQKMMAYFMPVMFCFMIWSLPSAFVLYWFLFNVFTTWQQYHFIKAVHEEHGTGPAAVITSGKENTETKKEKKPIESKGSKSKGKKS